MFQTKNIIFIIQFLATRLDENEIEPNLFSEVYSRDQGSLDQGLQGQQSNDV